MRPVWLGILLVGLLAAAACGRPVPGAAGSPSAIPATGASIPDCEESAGSTGSPSLRQLAAAPAGWELVRANQSLGDPFFVDLLGRETGQWAQEGCFAAWSSADHGSLIIQSFRFDTEEHAAAVWSQLRELDGWEHRYTIDGLPSIHVAVTEIPGGAGFHEAYRHIDRHLVTFALPAGSPTARPDPAFEQILRRHVRKFPG